MKKIVTLLMVLIAVLFVSCTEDEYTSEPETFKQKFDSSQVVITNRIAFENDKDIVYNLKLIHNYLPSDLLVLSASFVNDEHNDVVSISFFDDGGLAEGSFDFIAANNLWTGVINSNAFKYEGVYRFKVIASVKPLGSHNFYDIASVTEDIIVKNNSKPEIVAIDGLETAETLESGFDKRNVLVAVSDEDNDESGQNDSQELYMELYDAADVMLRQKKYTRESNSADFDLDMDSTYAAGLQTGEYSFRFYAVDVYDVSSDPLEVTNIIIENKPPVIDSLNISQKSDVYVFWVDVNDGQGNLLGQDIQNVKMKFEVAASYNEMKDDGNSGVGGFSEDENENDGIYTIAFETKFFEESEEYPFHIIVTDKAENISDTLRAVLKPSDFKK